jgi:hypothetical protein
MRQGMRGVQARSSYLRFGQTGLKERDRTRPIAENGAFELLYGWDKSLPYLQKAVRPDL